MSWLKRRGAVYRLRRAVPAMRVYNAHQDDVADRLRRPRAEGRPPDEEDSVKSGGDEEAEYHTITDALNKLEGARPRQRPSGILEALL
jgi:hypothetical protein